MLTARPPATPNEGEPPQAPAVPVISIQQFESSDIEAAPATAGQRPARRESVTAPADESPRPTSGAPRAAQTDVQTSSGVPPTPIAGGPSTAAPTTASTVTPPPVATVTPPTAPTVPPATATTTAPAAPITTPPATPTTAPTVPPTAVPVPVVPGDDRKPRSFAAAFPRLAARRGPEPLVVDPPPLRTGAADNRARRVTPDLGRAPLLLTVSSLGVLLVALAYAGGRDGTAGAMVAYWLGQIVVFTPIVVRLLSRRLTGVAESFLLVVGLAVNQYFLKWMYSPDQFRFPDELQHWAATTLILESGQLFQPNPALPPAVHFPGLAEMGAAVASMTGLPVTAAGLLVAGLAHLLFVAALYAAVLRASTSAAVAGVTCVIYATSLHYLFFNSMYLYATGALAFFMLTIWATRRWRTGGGWPFAVVAAGAMFATTVTHHVTAFVLVATLGLLGLTELVTAGRPLRRGALVAPAVGLAIVAGWVGLVARDVIAYLRAPVDQIVTTVQTMVAGGERTAEAAAGSAPVSLGQLGIQAAATVQTMVAGGERTAEAAAGSAPVSLGQLGIQAAGLLMLFALYLAVALDTLRRRDRDAWRWAALIGGGVFFAGNGVRFLGESGPEIAGRLSTYTYVPISIVAALALVHALRMLPRRDGGRWSLGGPAPVAPTGRRLVLRIAAGATAITLLMAGARVGGWPPTWEVLPGPYLAAGFERSVDASAVAAAHWQRTALGPGNRVGGDVTALSLASTYGRQDPVREAAPLFYAERWGPGSEALVRGLYVQYLVVDQRLGTQLPASGEYFEHDPLSGRHTRPLSATQLTKFDDLTDVDRLYDNGAIRIYRLGVQ